MQHEPSRQSAAPARRYSGLLALAALSLMILAGWSLPLGRGARAEAASSADQTIGRYTFADLADKVLPSVVTIYVKRDIKASLSPEKREQFEQFKKFFNNPQLRQFFGPDMMPNTPDDGDDGDQNPFIVPSSGSGVVISEDGYIITNCHVVGDVSDKSDIRVVFSDDSEVKGNDVKLIFSHPVTDLAILKVNRKGLKPIRWGSSDKLRIGERVAAVGSPLDLRATITQGIICAKHRDVDGSAADMLQTDAVINPGSSGGALVNLDGELVGINRLITTNSGRWQGYGFALPSDDAHRFANDVLSTGKVSYGYIGIQMGSEAEDTQKMHEALGLDKDQKGVLITSVTKGGPADQAGLRVGDYITKADGQDIESSGELLRNVMRHRVGDTIKLKVLRGNENGKVKEESFKLTVSERPNQRDLEAQLRGGSLKAQPSPTPTPAGGMPLGLSLEPYSQNGQTGLKVTGVEANSPAARAGISEGDVLLSLNRTALQSQEDFDKALRNKAAGRQHIAQVLHQERQVLVTIDEK